MYQFGLSSTLLLPKQTSHAGAGDAGSSAVVARELKEEAEVEAALRLRLDSFLSDAALGALHLSSALTSFERMVRDPPQLYIEIEI